MKIINYLKETIKKEKHVVRFIIITFIIGLIIGSLFINFVNENDKNTLISQVETFFRSIKQLDSSVYGITSFKNFLINNISQLLIIFVLGISMIGIIVVIFIMFFKGFMLGATLSSFILKYQLKGVIASFLYIFPVYILNLIIYILISYFAINASLKFLKAIVRKDNLNFKSFLGKYILSFLIGLGLMIIVCILDSTLTPVLLKLFTFLL